jgi:hypothetical protein
VNLGLKNNPDKYTKSVLKQVAMGKGVDYTHMCWLNDFKLLILSWIYDLNFTYSKKEFINRGFLQRIFAGLPDTVEISGLHEKLKKFFYL